MKTVYGIIFAVEGEILVGAHEWGDVATFIGIIMMIFGGALIGYQFKKDEIGQKNTNQ